MDCRNSCKYPIYDTCSDVYSEGIVSIEQAVEIFPLYQLDERFITGSIYQYYTYGERFEGGQ